MKVLFCFLLFFGAFGLAIQCNAQGTIVKGHIAHTGGVPLQVVVENDSTGALLLGSCNGGGDYKLNLTSFGRGLTISCFFYNCNGIINDTAFYISDSVNIITWNSDYCTDYTPNAVLIGNFLNASPNPINITIRASNDSIIAQQHSDSMGNYSILIPPSYSLTDIKCSFTNCHSATIDTIFLANHDTITWIANYCPPLPPNPLILSGNLSNTNGVPITIAFSTDSPTTFHDTTTTNLAGDYSILIPYQYLSGTINCSFVNCKKQFIDTSFTLNDSTQWNSDYCPPTTSSCPISFTTSYCPCSNTFFIQLDTSNIPYHHWSVQWNFGEGTTSSQLFPTHSFQSRSLYNVCVSLFDSTQVNPVCTYCHSIGFDSTGNLVTRIEDGGGTFNLQVIPAGTLQQYLNTPSNSFELYPNPVSTQAGIMIYSDEQRDYNVTVADAVGQRVISKIQSVPGGSSNFSLDVEKLPQGVYFMTINFEYGQMTKMFIKN